LVGATTGASVGCIACLIACNHTPKALPVAQVVEPIVIQNVYLVGQPKTAGAY